MNNWRLQNNLAAQKKSFINGKACFFNIAEYNYSDEHIKYLKKNYDKVVKIITTKPKNESNCADLYYMFNECRCIANIFRASQSVYEVSIIDMSINDTRLLKAQKSSTAAKVECCQTILFVFETLRFHLPNLSLQLPKTRAGLLKGIR